MPAFLDKFPKLNWLKRDDIKPFVYMRRENLVPKPSQMHKLDWFDQEPIWLDPFRMETVEFANQILRIEAGAFEASGMPMPRWVFYDCALMPGFVCGFAIRGSAASAAVRKVVQATGKEEWIPLSLFIIIPTMGRANEWLAHNLSSINSLLSESERFYGLGFLTKAYGLWYANIDTCCGMTQWGNTSIRLHSHYGDFEILTAYTPVHSHATTLTYRLKVKPVEWGRFFTREPSPEFSRRYEPASFEIDPKSVDSMKAFQTRLESGEGPFFLDSNEIRNRPLDSKLQIHRPLRPMGVRVRNS